MAAVDYSVARGPAEMAMTSDLPPGHVTSRQEESPPAATAGCRVLQRYNNACQAPEQTSRMARLMHLFRVKVYKLDINFVNFTIQPRFRSIRLLSA